MQVLIYSSYHLGHRALYRDIFEMTKLISEDYPGYQDWYHNTFLEGLKKGNRSYAVAVHRADLAGCVLMKDTPDEKKICTFFVTPMYRRQGVGTCLMDAAIEKLGPNPFLTVPITKIEFFSPFLKRWGFQMKIMPHKNQDTPGEVLFTRSDPRPVQKAHFFLPFWVGCNTHTPA